MNIYLVRHGKKQVRGFNDDVELTEVGFKQAELAGKRLKKYNIDVIYSSDLIRTIQTAETIKKHVDVDIEIREELREIFFGDLEGKDSEYITNNFTEFYEEFNKREKDMPYPNGECGEDVRKRAMKVINEIKEKGYKNIVITAHGGTIRALISGILGLNQERRFFLGLPFENCSISVVKYNEKDDRYYVHTMNDYSHIEDMK